MKPDILHTLETFPKSAEVVVPLIIEMLQPQSVADFGSGVGCWLQEFRRLKVKDILGIDGPYITKHDLLIPQECFLPFDLERIHELRIGRTFDLALSLECAEHLESDVAIRLIKTMCDVSQHVVFAAAVPGQTGMRHKNEQYPEYWQDLFARQGFEMFDYFRPLIWNNASVEFWYRQNMYLFSRAPRLFQKPAAKWDGSVYITRDLLDMYVRVFGTRNVQGLIKPVAGFGPNLPARILRKLSSVASVFSRHLPNGS